MSDNNRNLRLFLQTQAGLNELSGRASGRAEIPGEHVSNSIVFGNHTVSRASTLLVKKQSHQRVSFYDPSRDGQAVVTQQQLEEQKKIAESQAVVELVEEEFNLQGFQVRDKVDVTNPFADIGIVFEDEDAVAEDEDMEVQVAASNQELNSSNVVDPAQVYEELSSKGAKNFGISKEELASFQFKLRQLKSLYTDVTGKSSMNIPSGKMKRRIREVAAQNYADFTRVMKAIEKARGI